MLDDEAHPNPESKLQAVLRVLRGESPDAVAEDLQVSAATLESWCSEVLRHGLDGLRESDAEFRDLQRQIARARGTNRRLRARLDALSTQDNRSSS